MSDSLQTITGRFVAAVPGLRLRAGSILVSCLLATWAVQLAAELPWTAAVPTHLVFMIGEEEYYTWETLPEFAEKDLKPRGYRITIITANTAAKNTFPGLVNALKDADLLFLSVRRRFPPKEQLEAVRAYLAAGRPLVGIRTASHAFALGRNEKLPDAPLATWQEFDSEVFGGHYTTYYRNEQKTTIAFAPNAEAHPISQGLSVTRLIGNCPLYIVSPLAKDATPLLLGTTPVLVGSSIELRTEPVAWTRLHGAKRSRVFYTSLGGPDDFKNPEFRRLLVNSVVWALGR